MVYSCNNLLELSMSLTVEKQLEVQKSFYPVKKEDGICPQLGVQTFRNSNPVVDVASVAEN